MTSDKEYRQRPEVKEWQRIHEQKYRAKPEAKAKRAIRMSSYHRKQRYGLTDDHCEWILLAQGGKCLICGEDLDEKWVVDHCHETGMIRGLLHQKCNIGIAMLGDDPKIIRAAEVYVTG